jgi:hypothetical protein
MRPKNHKQKPSLKIRTKRRPASGDGFNIELRLCKIAPLDTLGLLGGDTTVGTEIHQEMREMLSTIRSIIGHGYNIIKNKHHSGFWLTTKILLKNESDMLILSMTYPMLICKVYRYI